MSLEPSAAGYALRIRTENSQNSRELASIRAVNTAAFGRSDEADLVDQLRAGLYVLASHVAEADGRIVGYLMFSRMSIDASDACIPAAALAPVAVLPEFQRRGIGSLLIQRGLELLRADGESIVIVLGHPDFYPRFGFSPEKARRLLSPFPPAAFMALELTPGALDGISGRVVYPPPFGI
jgi:putative acetyltransferase